MSNEPLPDWCAVNEIAYIVQKPYRAGVGDYPVARRVRIVQITAMHVKVRPATSPPSDTITTFRRRDLRAIRPGSTYSARDRLAGPDDPDVRQAKRLARLMAALPGDEAWRQALRTVDRATPSRAAQGLPAALTTLKAALKLINDETGRALVELERLESVL